MEFKATLHFGTSNRGYKMVDSMTSWDVITNTFMSTSRENLEYLLMFYFFPVRRILLRVSVNPVLCTLDTRYELLMLPSTLCLKVSLSMACSFPSGVVH